MKKITKVFTTTIITFALMAAAPAAMASHDSNSYGEIAQYVCKTTNNLADLGFDFKNQGECVAAVVAFLKAGGS